MVSNTHNLAAPAAGSTSPANDGAIAYLRELALQGFWGNIIFKLQGGTVVHVTREESIPADKLNRTNRSRGAYGRAE